MFSPRRFQKNVNALGDDIKLGRHLKEIIAHVTTGAGKSTIPVAIANQLIPEIADKICWIVPRTSLRIQAEEVFQKPIMREWLGSMRTIRADQNDKDPCRGHHGYVTTYQAVDEDPGLHRREFERHRYILVLDEFHHIKESVDPDEGDGKWHQHIQPLVDRCKLLVLMTGVLDRGDRHRIAFMQYKTENGRTIPDMDETDSRAVVIYSRSMALEEKAILPIEFSHSDASIEFVNRRGEKKNGSSFSDSRFDADDYRDAVYSAISTDYAMQLLDTGVREWQGYVKTHPHSQLLIVANRVEKARDLNKLLKDKYGLRSKVAVAEDCAEGDRAIKEFRDRKIPVLTTVAKAYEGMDAPGITHIVALTQIRSRPWIEQMLGRTVRVDEYAGPWKGQRAFAYVPDDPLMNDVIDYIRRDQSLAVIEPDGDGGGPGGKRSDLIPIGSGLTTTRISELDGDQYSSDETLKAIIALQDQEVLGQIPISRFIKASRSFVDSSHDLVEVEVPCSTPSEREHEMRTRIQKVCNGLDFVLKKEHGSLNGEIYSHFRKSREDMTEDELMAVWAWINRKYGSVI